MKIIARAGRDDVAVVYLVEFSDGQCVECVESVQPPVPREKKWVIMISTLFGCPVGCAICDAGWEYHGKLTAEQMLEQVDFLVDQRFGSRNIPAQQFKIQFARMGEPALNRAVLDVLRALPARYIAPGLIPSISTIAPSGRDAFFNDIIAIKNEYYSGGRFQFQFSIHTTDPDLRRKWIPVATWSFPEMARFAEKFYCPGDRKITLNFALARNAPLNTQALRSVFSPDLFLIKLTPVNETYSARDNRISSFFGSESAEALVPAQRLRDSGYEVVVSIGDLEENRIGSNCGQYLRAHLKSRHALKNSYTYSLT